MEKPDRAGFSSVHGSTSATGAHRNQTQDRRFRSPCGSTKLRSGQESLRCQLEQIVFHRSACCTRGPTLRLTFQLNESQASSSSSAIVIRIRTRSALPSATPSSNGAPGRPRRWRPAAVIRMTESISCCAPSACPAPEFVADVSPKIRDVMQRDSSVSGRARPWSKRSG